VDTILSALNSAFPTMVHPGRELVYQTLEKLIKERKVYIATGYGLEGAIPDITAKEIVDNEIIPNFKGGDADNYYRGFNHAADAIIKAANLACLAGALPIVHETHFVASDKS